jgi:DNA-binding MurR/RpiR family transcriptional regulator
VDLKYCFVIVGVLGTIRTLLPSLNPGEAKVAAAVLANPERVLSAGAAALAAEAGASAATVVRCCRSLGFGGFQDFKLALARDSASPSAATPAELHKRDTPSVILHKLLSADADALRNADATVEPAALAAAVVACAKASRILFAGVGTSANVAQDASYRFRLIGLATEAPPDIHVQQVAARLLRKGDVCIVVSHRGTTEASVATATAAREAGATVIAITSFTRSPLTQIAHLAIVAGSLQTWFRVEAMASRVVHLCILDAMFVALAMRRQGQAIAALKAAGEGLADHPF